MISFEQNSIIGQRNDSNTIYCKLFADDVPKNICILRKRELNGRGEFTCIGCSWAGCS